MEDSSAADHELLNDLSTTAEHIPRTEVSSITSEPQSSSTNAKDGRESGGAHSPFAHSTRTTTKDPSSFILKTLTSSVRSVASDYLQKDMEHLDFGIITRETHEALDKLQEYIGKEEKEFFGEEKYLVASISLQLLHRYEQVLSHFGVTETSCHDLSAVEKWIAIWDSCGYKEQIYEIYEKTKSELLTKQGGTEKPEEIVMESNDKEDSVFVEQSEKDQVSEDNLSEIMDSGKFTSSRVEDRESDLIDLVPEFTHLKTYYRIMDTLAHVSRNEYIGFILNHLRERHMGMNTQTFEKLIESCETDESCDVALRYFDVMHQEKIEPNAYVISALLKVFIAAKDEHFLDVYKSFVENHELTSSDSLMLEEILLKGLVDVVHDFSTSLELLDLMQQKGRRITLEDYHNLFEAARQNGSKLDAIKIYEHMIKKEVEPDLYVCEKLCQTYAKHGDPKTFQIYHVLNQKHGFNDKKTIEIYNSFIQVAAIHHSHSKIKQLMHQMRQSGMRPNVVSHLHYGVSLYHTNWKSRMEAYLKSTHDPKHFVSKVPEDNLPFAEEEDDALRDISLGSDINHPEEEEMDLFKDALLFYDEIEEEIKPQVQSDVSAFNPALKKELESMLGRQAYKDLLLRAEEEYQQDITALKEVPETTDDLFSGEYQPSYDEDFVPSSVGDLFASMEYEKKHTNTQQADHQLLSLLSKRAEKSGRKIPEDLREQELDDTKKDESV